MKGTKDERQDIHSIQVEITKMNNIIELLKWKKIKIPSKIFPINNKIKVTFEFIIKVA